MDTTLLKDGRFRRVAWNNGASSKADALGWATDFGKRGKLTQINKQNLRLDIAYQRRQSTEKARRIAREFNWLGFGVVVVSERPNGDYFVLDGGHRVMATMMRPEIKNVPCYAFSDLSKADEAAAFVCFNAHRKAPTGLELFAAQVMAGDQDARAVAKIMRNHNVPVHRDGCRCPRKLIKLYSSLGEERFNALIGLVINAWPEQPDSERLADQVVSGLAAFVKALGSVGLSFDSSEVARALKKMSLVLLKKRAHEIRELGTRNRTEAFKAAFAEAWNKGRRAKRLPPIWSMAS